MVQEQFTNENQIKTNNDTVNHRLQSPESLQFVGLNCKQMLPILSMIDQKDTKLAK